MDVTVNDQATDFLLRLDGELENPRDLNESLGLRLAEELQDYFMGRNAQPNKRGWKKQGWWAGVADATQLDPGSVSDDGATVTVAHRQGFTQRVRGGTIVPREKESLTIPNIEEAYGRSVAVFKQATGVSLFRPAGARYLAFSDDGGESITVAYFLVRSVKIKADDKALPPIDTLKKALTDEATVYLEKYTS